MILKRLVLTILLLGAVMVAASSQSLLDDPEYRELINRLEELQAQAQTAVDEGRYGEAVELSSEARQVAQEAEEYAEQRVLAFRANGWINRATERYALAERYRAEVRYPKAWNRATEQLDTATERFADREYQPSINAAQTVISALEVVDPPPAVVREQESAEPEAAEEEAELPRYYIVRLIPERRDSFWRIAEYDFVYGNPFMWQVLYEANKEKLRDPENPDLIHPGQRFVIPSLEGETRAGVWNPQDAVE
ncbi:MAG: hypothetical protein GVY29_13710 [Spirochaetes bacterium]|jgi:nucleoid-associated protein YgaU|nr:hypothetical protein [Spirochaetota bacterium]